MTESGVRTRAVALTFVIGLVVIGAALYLWWPLGVVMGLVFAVTGTIGIGRHLQATAAEAPSDDQLLEALGVAPASGARVTHTVWNEDPMRIGSVTNRR